MSRRLTPPRAALWCAAIFVLSVINTPPTMADIFEWTNATNGFFPTAGNWTLVSGASAAPPSVTDTARFNEAAPAYTVSFSSSPTNDVLDFDDVVVT